MAARSPVFDCTFLFSAEELVGNEPYAIFEDDAADPFARELIAACRGRTGALYGQVTALKNRSIPVFMAAPVWHRNHEALIAAGVSGERARVVLYFDIDPSGYWDFAKACHSSLAHVFKTRTLDRQAVESLAPFLEEWLGARPFADRLTYGAGFSNQEFRALVERNGAAVAKVFSHLADDISRSTYARILFGGLEEILAAFARQVFGEQQYMEIIDFSRVKGIINCGVGRGWELPYFIAKTEGDCVINNFDPTICYDSSPFAEFLASLQHNIKDERIILGAQDGQIDLPMSHASMVSHASAKDTDESAPEHREHMVTYPMRSIDSLAAQDAFSEIDLIKMDVEGGERYILDGAIDTIRRLRPNLAIAIYHEPQHFWEYPSYILDKLDDYRLYIRQYGYSKFETLLYAIPKERDLDRPRGVVVSGPPSEPERRVEGAEASFYLYDIDSRSSYFGQNRVLSRFEGASWRTGDLEGGPRVDADRMIAVWEGSGQRYFATRHRFEDDKTRVTLGRGTESPLDVEWKHSFGCAPDASVLPIWNLGDAIGFAVYEPLQQTGVGLMDPDTGEIRWTAACGYTGTPVLVSALDGDLGYELYAQCDDRLSLYYCQFNSSRSRSESEVLYDLPKPVRGVVRLKRYVQGRVEQEPAFAVGDPDENVVELLVVRSSGLLSVGSIDLDHRSMVVPCLDLAPKAPSPDPRAPSSVELEKAVAPKAKRRSAPARAKTAA